MYIYIYMYTHIIQNSPVALYTRFLHTSPLRDKFCISNICCFEAQHEYTRPLRGLVWYSAFAAVPPTRAPRSGYPSDHDTLSAHCWDICMYMYIYTYEHWLSRHVWCTPLECTFNGGTHLPEHLPLEFTEESALKSTLPKGAPLYVNLCMKRLWGAPSYAILRIKWFWGAPSHVNLRMK